MLGSLWSNPRNRRHAAESTRVRHHKPESAQTLYIETMRSVQGKRTDAKVDLESAFTHAFRNDVEPFSLPPSPRRRQALFTNLTTLPSGPHREDQSRHQILGRCSSDRWASSSPLGTATPRTSRSGGNHSRNVH